jgi:hypothetical protein
MDICSSSICERAVRQQASKLPSSTLPLSSKASYGCRCDVALGHALQKVSMVTEREGPARHHVRAQLSGRIWPPKGSANG